MSKALSSGSSVSIMEKDKCVNKHHTRTHKGNREQAKDRALNECVTLKIPSDLSV